VGGFPTGSETFLVGFATSLGAGSDIFLVVSLGTGSDVFFGGSLGAGDIFLAGSLGAGSDIFLVGSLDSLDVEPFCFGTDGVMVMVLDFLSGGPAAAPASLTLRKALVTTPAAS